MRWRLMGLCAAAILEEKPVYGEGRKMRDILLEHWSRYPEMEIQDLVKLVYQSEFGGGHLIQDGDESLRRLKAEYEGRQWDGDRVRGTGQLAGREFQEAVSWEIRGTAVRENPRAEGWEFQEPAGYGMCRVKLAAMDLGLAPETLNQMFVRSAAEVKGSTEGLEQGLKLLWELCGVEDAIAIPGETVRAYLRQYRADGYPVVVHSDRYRKLYHPGYRIVNSMYGKYLQLFISIDKLLKVKGKETVNIAVDGMSASGKSTLARLLAGIYGCNVFHMDDFFLQPFQRTTARLREPGGNVDYERFKAQVTDHLSDSKGVEYQVYDCGRQELAKRVSVPHRRLNVIEGSYSQHPYFGDCYDLRVFLEIGREEQVDRIRRRNGEFMLRRFVEEWIPMENTYFEEGQIREKSHIRYLENTCKCLGSVG